VVSVIVMILASIVGFYLFDDYGGPILFALIAGIACIVYTIDNQGKHE
jgi:hypothetical protein